MVPLIITLLQCDFVVTTTVISFSARFYWVLRENFRCGFYSSQLFSHNNVPNFQFNIYSQK